MTTLDDMLALRPVDETAVEAHKKQMMAEVRAYRLREQAGNTSTPSLPPNGLGSPDPLTPDPLAALAGLDMLVMDAEEEEDR